jgi:hypothetical protein
MNKPSPTPTPAPSPAAHGGRPAWRVIRALAVAAALGFVGYGMWVLVGEKTWSEYQAWREQARATEDSAPVGYVGLNYRRAYNDRPAVFNAEKDGRALLFAAKGEGSEPEYYDVTGITIDVTRLEGGFGRDSIPGIDYPIIDPAAGAPGRALRPAQPVFGVTFSSGPRAYPKDLLDKIEVVNDADGPSPRLVLFDRAAGNALVFDRTVDGAPVTFGTTGYSYNKHPLVYDRKTRSLWLPEGSDLVCLNGPLKGRRLTASSYAEPSPWSEWRDKHPKTTVVVGNDRDRPIPAE